MPNTESESVPAQPAAGQPAPSDVRTVLDEGDVRRILTRIAHEIVENAKGARDLVVLGIPTRGAALAQRLASAIEEIEGCPVLTGTLDITMYRDDLNTQPTRALTPTSIPPGGIDEMTVVLVDDVLYSGRTVRAAMDALSDLGRPRAIRLAVLVDRGHRELPIRADHVGKNIPTARDESVRVLVAAVDGRDAVVVERRPKGDDR